MCKNSNYLMKIKREAFIICTIQHVEATLRLVDCGVWVKSSKFLTSCPFGIQSLKLVVYLQNISNFVKLFVLR